MFLQLASSLRGHAAYVTMGLMLALSAATLAPASRVGWAATPDESAANASADDAARPAGEGNAAAASNQVASPHSEQRLEALRAQLEKDLSGAVLVGQFTVTGQAPAGPAEERYELAAVRHLGNDRWLFQARIQYGEHDVTLPLTLPIRWAGDTPVITVDNFGFPGLGTYTARVMVYRDHYAGFWTGSDHGGHLFGVVQRGAADQAAAESN